ncbi:MAG: chemotaxis protein CheB [Verrucomicrobiota bacterium]|nr:chemotaxis protein CheB [Verrucomicrobiota bacterium]
MTAAKRTSRKTSPVAGLRKVHRVVTRLPAKARTEPAGGKPAEANQPFLVVGIGASAGGLEAMTALLKQLPSDTGMAFVLVQHLDPTHESALTAILTRSTGMPVSEARHNARLAPNQLYVIPPNKLMGISGRRLKLLPHRDSDTSPAVDHFFQSLAEAEGNRAIGVVLSGNGSDGTQGLRAIKAAGGITFAQEEKTAKYPAMPGSAITAECADFVLPPERIAQELSRIADHPLVAPIEETEPERPAELKGFEDILLALRQHTGGISRSTSGPRCSGASSGGWSTQAGVAPRLRRLPALQSPRDQGALRRHAHPRDGLFPGSGHVPDAPVENLPAPFQIQIVRRPGPHLGAGLFDRRGGLFPDHRRAGIPHRTQGAQSAANFRDRHQRQGAGKGPGRAIPRNHQDRRLCRPPAPVFHEGRGRHSHQQNRP